MPCSLIYEDACAFLQVNYKNLKANNIICEQSAERRGYCAAKTQVFFHYIFGHFLDKLYRNFEPDTDIAE